MERREIMKRIADEYRKQKCWDMGITSDEWTKLCLSHYNNNPDQPIGILLNEDELKLYKKTGVVPCEKHDH